MDCITDALPAKIDTWTRPVLTMLSESNIVQLKAYNLNRSPTAFKL
jgi:hypothetical protein